MFSRFKITATDLRIYLSDIRTNNVRDIYSEDSNLILETASDKIVAASHNGIVDADRLKDGFFPTAFRKQYKVFISHSHKDIEVVKQFANTMANRYHVRCFVDSLLWGNMEDLLSHIDNKYCLSDDSQHYDYYKRNLSTSHVHAMLSIALLEMISQCECCIFVQSDNSIIPSLPLADIQGKDKTFSPWIYEEINYMNQLQPYLPDQRRLMLFSSLNESIKRDIVNPVPIAHGINLDKFVKLDRAKMPYGNLGNESWLDVLYKQMGLTQNKQRLL